MRYAEQDRVIVGVRMGLKPLSPQFMLPPEINLTAS